ncbi:MAG: hypothetical protein JNK17_02145 [Hydrogenophaga sp.]|nr:hypothetical protein [Hydrogenophaga sp.]
MGLLGPRPNQVPTNGDLGSLAWWSAEQFEARVAQIVAALTVAPFAAGTKMLFSGSASPSGWTLDTTHNNKALRVVSSAAVGSGGSVAFTTAFANRTLTGSVAATTLTASQMPAHEHSLNAPNSNGQPTATGIYTGLSLNYGTGIYAPQWWQDRAGYNEVKAASVGGGGSHTHGWSGTLDMAVQYVDVFFAVKA